jgi:hypothetical protein
MSSMTAALITKRKMMADAQRKAAEAKRKEEEAKRKATEAKRRQGQKPGTGVSATFAPRGEPSPWAKGGGKSKKYRKSKKHRKSKKYRKKE